MTDAEKVVHNERNKLRATMMNNIGVAIIVTGLIVPIVNFVYTGIAPNRSVWPLVALIWLAAGVASHQIGHRLLGRIKP